MKKFNHSFTLCSVHFRSLFQDKYLPLKEAGEKSLETERFCQIIACKIVIVLKRGKQKP